MKAPKPRLGDDLRTVIRSLTGFQKEALALGNYIKSDPVVRIDLAEPTPGNWNELCIKGGLTPIKKSANEKGIGLMDCQKRMLHLRGVCTLRPDGIKEITQYLYKPHGSVFTLLSEEGPENGGHGRAPDATTYISAGIGFCFMTQLGRYAKIKRMNLKDYWIVQDTHFSLGGVSGGTGLVGKADPVETHVHMDSGENDEFARAALDISEQTCFMHAFCKTDLKAKIRLTEFGMEEDTALVSSSH